MKKLLFFIESLSGGGAEKALVTLIDNLDRNDYDITVISLVDKGPFKEELRRRPVRYLSAIPDSSSLFEKFCSKVRYKLIYRILPVRWAYRCLVPPSHFDLSIAFTEGFPTKLLSRAPGRKIAWVHTDLVGNPWPLKVGIYRDSEEEKAVYARYDKVVCVSNVAENSLKRKYGLSNTVTIYNLIDKAQILSQARTAPRTGQQQGFHIIAVGRLVQQKGFSKLIPIVARVRQERPDVHLSIVGDGPDRDSLKALARQCGAEASVHFFGFQKNPYALMQRADLLVSPARSEGFGLVIAEAMVLGLPVIGMKSSGTNELLGNGRYGALCDTYDSLEKTLERVIRDPSFLKELADKSARGSGQFDLTSTVQQVRNVFDSLCPPGETPVATSSPS